MSAPPLKNRVVARIREPPRYSPIGQRTEEERSTDGLAVQVPGDAVASDHARDTSLQHSREREFGFREIAQGNLPLWNPHIYSGMPFHGSIQAALTYPPNVVYLILPLAKALSFDLFFQVVMLGLLTYAWVRYKGLRGQGAFVAACMMMLATTCSFRVLAGQINVVGTFTWTPLLLLSVDKIIDRGAKSENAINWCLVGIFATTMA